MLWRALGDVPQGFYVDVGAFDPKVDSVTLAFSQRGWRGINIEPGPGYQAIAAKRPNDVNLQVAVGRSEGIKTYYQMSVSSLSSLDPAIAKKHVEAGMSLIERSVEIRTLTEILTEHAQDVDDIHFLKIDVEGSEADVLAGLDFTKFRPWILLIEATEPNTTRKVQSLWEPIVIEAGYVFVWFDGLNRFYIAQERAAALAERFDSPPNVFDDWIKIRDVDVRTQLGQVHAELVDSRSREVDVSTQLDRVHRELVDSRSELGSFQQELVAARAAIDRYHLELSEAVRNSQNLNADHGILKREFRILSKQLLAIKAENRAILASNSWQVTLPLRVLKQQIMNLIR